LDELHKKNLSNGGSKGEIQSHKIYPSVSQYRFTQAQRTEFYFSAGEKSAALNGAGAAETEMTSFDYDD